MPLNQGLLNAKAAELKGDPARLAQWLKVIPQEYHDGIHSHLRTIEKRDKRAAR